jgi:hypothetical protein
MFISIKIFIFLYKNFLKQRFSAFQRAGIATHIIDIQYITLLLFLIPGSGFEKAGNKAPGQAEMNCKVDYGK